MSRDILIFIEEGSLDAPFINGLSPAIEKSMGDLQFSESLAEGIEKVRRQSAENYPPRAVIIGRNVTAPAAAGREIHRLVPNAQLIFLIDDTNLPTLQNTLKFASLPAAFWTFGSAANAESLLKTIRHSVEVSRRRRQLRTTLDKINLKLSGPAPDSLDLRRLVISDRYLAGILTQAQDSIISTDMRGKIISVNKAAAETFGYSEQELISENFQKLIAETEREAIRELISQAQTTALNFKKEFTARCADGTTFDIDLSGAVIKDEAEKQQLGIVFIAHDVTDHKQRERRLASILQQEQYARRKAEEADRMKDEFLTTLSHELRTPLNAILGWAQMLRRQSVDEQTKENAIITIERSARAQSQLIDDILDVSRIINGKLRLDVRSVDLPDVISAALDAVRPAADAKNIRLQSLLDPRVEPISGDPDRLQQIVWNLLTNAIKFTPKGGRVQVRLERINSHIEIVVSDTGKGIEAEFLPHVFDRFRQSDGSMTRRHGGLGLGLALVRQLVELHGGTVSVSSQGEGAGATFTIALPLLPVRVDPESDVPRLYPAVARIEKVFDCPPELTDLHILIIDDDQNSRELLKAVLEICSTYVTEAATAAEALDLIGRGKFDVIISDIGMPDEDGLSLISKIRNLPETDGGKTPAIALTAYVNAEIRIEALRAGFQMHVPKPVEPSELIAVIASLTGQR